MGVIITEYRGKDAPNYDNIVAFQEERNDFYYNTKLRLDSTEHAIVKCDGNTKALCMEGRSYVFNPNDKVKWPFRKGDAQGYAAMDAYFQTLVADLPAYVPQPQVMGEVDSALLETMTQILDGTGIANLDTFSISQLPLDDTFGFAAGLSGMDGITGAVSCAPMMMTTAYSLVIVTLEDETKAESVADDFENTMDWRKWVCVAPSHALLAQKDNMVLCLMANSDLFLQTQRGVEAAGWTVTKTLENPDM